MNTLIQLQPTDLALALGMMAIAPQSATSKLKATVFSLQPRNSIIQDLNYCISQYFVKFGTTGADVNAQCIQNPA